MVTFAISDETLAEAREMVSAEEESSRLTAAEQEAEAKRAEAERMAAKQAEMERTAAERAIKRAMLDRKREVGKQRTASKAAMRQPRGSKSKDAM